MLTLQGNQQVALLRHNPITKVSSTLCCRILSIKVNYAILRQQNTTIFEGKSDGVVVNYIAQSIRHSYIRLSKQQAKVNSNETLFEDLSEGQRYYVENANTCTNNELLEITELLSGKNLTDSERNVLIWEFCFGMTSAEIARAKSVSRQSINQIKKRAIQKLRKELERDGIPLHEELS